MKPVTLGVFKSIVAIAAFGLASISSYADTVIGAGGVLGATTTPSQQVQQPQQSIVSGPSIWRIGAPGGLAPLSQLPTPMVMPQTQYHQDYGIHSRYPSNSTIIIVPSYDPGYGYTGPMGYYPSVFGLYDGLPEYIYTPSYWITMDSSGNWVFQEIGSYYPYFFDPFEQTDLQFTPNGQFGFLVQNTLDTFATDWSESDNNGLTSLVVPTGTVSMGVGDQYEYNISSPAYLQLASNALKSVTTTDFHYTGVRIRPDGDVLAAAVQTYRAPDGTLGRSNLKIVFTPTTSGTKGYKITGFSVQKLN